MESWEFDFEWLQVRHFIKDRLGNVELPSLSAVLLMIGVQELGKIKKERFSKEEKTDLLHIASCRLLSQDGYYGFKGLDDEGWPHYEVLRPFTMTGVKEQEKYLKEKIIEYFKNNYPEEFKNN